MLNKLLKSQWGRHENFLDKVGNFHEKRKSREDLSGRSRVIRVPKLLNLLRPDFTFQLFGKFDAAMAVQFLSNCHTNYPILAILKKDRLFASETLSAFSVVSCTFQN